MDEERKPSDDGGRRLRRIPTVSAVVEDGAVVEMVYDPNARTTGFVVARDGEWSRAEEVRLDETHQLVPYSPGNNLLRNGVVLLPSAVEEYASEAALVADIQAFIHRYVDVSPLFERIASYYVLLSWVYDAFNELPYLRLRGDPGSGKTRFLLTVGSLCYKPIFASGASTVSPLFRLLDSFRGTLVIDEGDFRVSDEKAEVVKILNNGNARGFPVLRSEVSGKRGEFNPRAYQVYGPKLVASRGFFDDRALESRFITERMGEARLRDDIPINLPPAYESEARHLRNQLLLFRFRNHGRARPSEALVDRGVEPRLNQVFVPLLSIIDDPAVRGELRAVMRRYHDDILTERSTEMDAQLLEIVCELAAEPGAAVTVKETTARFADRHQDDYDRKVTTKWIGTVLRRRLGLKAVKQHGVFVVPDSELEKLPRLREKYGLAAGDQSEGEENAAADVRVDVGTLGTLPEGM